jgi:hypothetical protein
VTIFDEGSEAEAAAETDAEGMNLDFLTHYVVFTTILRESV